MPVPLVCGEGAPYWPKARTAAGGFYLLNADQGHLLGGRRLLERQGGHGFDEQHASLLQTQRAGQSVEALGSLGSGVSVPWTGPRDQAEVLQGEVEDGGTGAVKALGLLRVVRRGRSRGGFEKANAGGCDLQGRGRSGSWW